MQNIDKQPTTTLTLADLIANPNDLYQVSQVSEIFKRHPETIRRWIKAGKIPKPLSISGMYYFKGSDLLDYINANDTEGA